MDRVVNRLVVALVAGTGVIGSSLIGIFAEEGPQIWGLHFLSVIGFSLSALLGIWLVWGVVRSGRL
jgi:ubiquinone biosynthesis protein